MSHVDFDKCQCRILCCSFSLIYRMSNSRNDHVACHLFYLPVPCRLSSCPMAILRKVHVALSNLRVEGHSHVLNAPTQPPLSPMYPYTPLSHSCPIFSEVARPAARGPHIRGITSGHHWPASFWLAHRKCGFVPKSQCACAAEMEDVSVEFQSLCGCIRGH